MAEELKNVEVTEETVAPEPKTEKVEPPKTSINAEADVQAQLQQLMLENAKLKRATDKATSEASEFKKKWRASLSEVEQASLEKAEREAEREEQFNALLRENNINKAEKTYLALGYTSDEASRMAVAEVDNDFDSRTKIMAEVDARKKKEYEAEWINNRPSVNAGVGGEKAPITKEEFERLGYKDIVDFKSKYPETYKVYMQN